MMNRHKLMHILRAIASITEEKNYVLIGSATVLLSAKNIPSQMLNTNEIDVYSPDSKDEEEFSFMVESIGKGSHFDNTFGYFGDGVSSKTAIMPADWQTRSRKIEEASLPGITVTVPDINDIALAKMCAWRDKDQEWLMAGVRALILKPKSMQARLPQMPESSTPRSEMDRRMQVVFSYGGPA